MRRCLKSGKASGDLQALGISGDWRILFSGQENCGHYKIFFIYIYLYTLNVWCNKNRTKHSIVLLLPLVQFLLHQTLQPKSLEMTLVTTLRPALLQLLQTAKAPSRLHSSSSMTNQFYCIQQKSRKKVPNITLLEVGLVKVSITMQKVLLRWHILEFRKIPKMNYL